MFLFNKQNKHSATVFFYEEYASLYSECRIYVLRRLKCIGKLVRVL